MSHRFGKANCREGTLGGGWRATRSVDATVCAVLASAAAVLAIYNYPLYAVDVDVFVLATRRILAGEVIYRDFWMVYPPGRFYLYAGLMKLFGVSHWAIKGSSILIFAAIPAGVYILTRRHTGVAAAAFAALLSIAAFPPSHKVFIPLFSVTTLWAVWTLARGATAFRLAVAGVNIGLAVLFKHEIGFVLGVATLLSILFTPAAADSPYASKLRRVYTYAAGIGVVILPCLAYLCWARALGPLYEQLVVEPYYAVSGMSLTVHPPLSLGVEAALVHWREELLSHVVYLTPLLYGVLLAWTGRRVVTGRADQRGLCIFFASLVGYAAFVNAVGRTDLPHVRQGIFPLFPLLAVALSGLAAGWRERGWTRPLRALGVVAILGYGFWFARTALYYAHITPSGERLRQIDTMPPYLQSLVDYVENNVEPGDGIFVVTRPMDVYNLTGRRNPFRYCGLFPGVFGRDPGRAEAALVTGLRAEADVVVYDMQPWGANPDRDELEEYAPRVHSFVSNECRPVAQVTERFVILRRK